MLNAPLVTTVVRMPLPDPAATMIFTKEDGSCLVVVDESMPSEQVERTRQGASLLASLPRPREPIPTTGA